MKILLVEDDIEISTMLKNFLITENFEVITALDGESACEKFFSDNFSLVLLDLMIPKMNGIEVMSKIREHNTVLSLLFLQKILILIKRLAWDWEQMIILQSLFLSQKYWHELRQISEEVHNTLWVLLWNSQLLHKAFLA